MTKDPVQAFETNALGPSHVAAAAFAADPNTWLFSASTSHVYKPHPASDPTGIPEQAEKSPTTFYGVSKLSGELLLKPFYKDLGFAICVGRLFSFSHATQEPPFLIPSLRARILELDDGGPLRVSNSTAVRDILDVETVVDCVLHLAERQVVGVLNIGSGLGTTVAGLARQLAAGIGRTIAVESAGEATADAVVANVRRLKLALASPAKS